MAKVTLEQIRQNIIKRVEAVRAKKSVAHRILSDISNKMNSVEQLLGNSANSGDDAFEVCSDMLLEQCEKQCTDLAQRIHSVRVELQNVRKQNEEDAAANAPVPATPPETTAPESTPAP